ncbi:ATP-binding protein [Streptomyces cinnabarinus]|uniref:ATP-binding protein n=1 Tax=Streptomyces cinnabarinus TaxID=67287 RepID=A0ABY7KTM9_9ACTN|nr:ATP-binding protein [Streptomyces cinnabarinus]WAZ18993.1 ATP-binding protein [Streptomyces cinnabarinus]WAZ26975.1 ATP-binding protein [Streptomyces cinnabarinus]
MLGPLGYGDAVRLLGGSGPVLAALDRVVGGALFSAAGPAPDLVLGLFDAKAELAELSRNLVSGLAERLQGLSRFGRTERLAAAHAVLVIAGYSEAMGQVELPFDHRQLGVSRVESVHLSTGRAPDSERLAAVAEHLLRAGLPVPSPHLPYEQTLEELLGYYAQAAELTAHYVAGCAVWDDLTAEAREEVGSVLADRVPALAVERYEELFRQLTADFPEVAAWIDRTDHRATRAVLVSLEDSLARVVDGALPPGRLAALHRAGVMGLDGSVLGSFEEIADGMVVPALREAYVSPDFRVAEYRRADGAIHQDYWWEAYERRSGLDAFLAELLVAPLAAQAPVLLLGQPGSGKSYLTKVLAARLPVDDFLVVRVALRSVPADAGVQEQIEDAVRQATGETMDWPAVVRAADGALPVVLLDGFDELLQATGLNQSDYLEQVAAFQRREAGFGRPLAVLVTSRTAVADRARLTSRGIAVRLEDFSPAQTRQWLQLWNGKNAGHFAQRGLQPLEADRVLCQPDLAGQPLLLLMLALYDAQDNAFQREAHDIAGFDLYERLLERFARREVLKHAPSLPERELAHAAEQELLRLSVAALAMFNRGRQWVTDNELDADLAVLLPRQFPPVSPAGLRAPVSRGQATVGRFFFVHRAEAFRDNELLRSYEFAHATFGEFLVARLVASELLELADAARPEARRTRSAAPDDAFLHALLSYAALCARTPVIRFLIDTLDPLPHERRARVRALLLDLFHEVQRERRSSLYADYRPAQRPVPARHALHSTNLLLLALATGEPVHGRELFPAAHDPVEGWTSLMWLAKSQLLAAEWHGLVTHVRLQRVWHEGRREVSVGLTDPQTAERVPEPASAPDPFWSRNWGPEHDIHPRMGEIWGWAMRDSGELFRDSGLLCDGDVDMLLGAVQGLYETGFGDLVTGFARREDGRAASSAHLLVRLWAESGTAGTPGGLSELHLDALRAIYAFDPARPEFTKRYLAAMLEQWRIAGHPVDQRWVQDANTAIDRNEQGLGRLITQLLNQHRTGD